MNDYGQYLGTRKQSFAIYQNKEVVKQIPFHKVSQILLGSGNSVSTSALFWASMFGVNVVVVSKTGKPLSMMLPLSVDKRVKTRIKQYEAYKNHKGVVIAKEIVKARVNSQRDLLEKHDLDHSKMKLNLDKIDVENETIDQVRRRLTGLEGKCSELYFKQYWTLFPEFLKPKRREKYRAQTPLNNLLNLGYEILKGEVYKAVMNAHLDPYLGYLHSIQFGKPSLVCDIQEIFKALIENFLITHHQNLEPESFEQKQKRTFLKPKQKLRLILEVNQLFEKRVSYERKKIIGEAMIRTVIKEETLKIARLINS